MFRNFALFLALLAAVTSSGLVWAAQPGTLRVDFVHSGNALTEMAQKMTRGVPQADGSIAIEAVMDVSHVASSVVHMASLPLDANVLFMTVMATKMPYIGRG